MISGKVNEMGLSKLEMSPTVPYSATPPWVIIEISIDLGLLEERQENNIDQYVVQSYLMEKYSEGVTLYTDASKRIDRRMGIAYVIQKLKIKTGERISDDLAVYTGELIAVWLALLWVEPNRPRTAVITSDSSSASISIQNFKSELRQDILLEIIQVANNLLKSGIKLTLV